MRLVEDRCVQTLMNHIFSIFRTRLTRVEGAIDVRRNASFPINADGGLRILLCLSFSFSVSVSVGVVHNYDWARVQMHVFRVRVDVVRL
jgi:hypothetical protein